MDINTILTVILTSSVIASLVTAFVNLRSSKKNREGLKEIEKLKKKFELIYKKIELFSNAKSELMKIVLSCNTNDIFNLKEFDSRNRLMIE